MTHSPRHTSLRHHSRPTPAAGVPIARRLAPATPDRRHILYVGPEGGCPSVEPLRTDPRLRIEGPVEPRQIEHALEEHEFDAALIDVDIGLDAFDLVLRLGEAEDPCRSVVVGTDLPRAMVREALLAGVLAALRKPVSDAVLAGALQQACDATLVMRQCLRSADARGIATLDRRAVDTSMLTKREREILQHLLEGGTTPTMARALSISPRTIKFHVSNMLRKMGVRSRLSLLAKIRRADAW